MSQDFFDKIDLMLKDILDHPVPQLLLEENKKTIYEYRMNSTEFDEVEYLKNFLIAHGYKYIYAPITKKYDLVMEYHKDDNPRKVKFQILEGIYDQEGDYDEFNEEESDFGVRILPGENKMEFISSKYPTRTILI